MSVGIISNKNIPRIAYTHWIDYDNISVTKNSYVTLTKDVSLSGFKLLGGVDYMMSNASSSGKNYNYCSIYRWNPNPTDQKTLTIVIRNWYSSDAKVKLSIEPLYVRDNYG